MVLCCITIMCPEIFYNCSRHQFCTTNYISYATATEIRKVEVYCLFVGTKIIYSSLKLDARTTICEFQPIATITTNYYCLNSLSLDLLQKNSNTVTNGLVLVVVIITGSFDVNMNREFASKENLTSWLRRFKEITAATNKSPKVNNCKRRPTVELFNEMGNSCKNCLSFPEY